jgi:hypothetical protein
MAMTISVPKGREGYYFELEAKPWVYQEIYRMIMKNKDKSYRDAVQYTNLNYDLFFVSDGGRRYFKIIGLETWILDRLRQTNDVYAGGVQQRETRRDERDEPERER